MNRNSIVLSDNREVPYVTCTCEVIHVVMLLPAGCMFFFLLLSRFVISSTSKTLREADVISESDVARGIYNTVFNSAVTEVSSSLLMLQPGLRRWGQKEQSVHKPAAAELNEDTLLVSSREYQHVPFIALLEEPKAPLLALISLSLDDWGSKAGDSLAQKSLPHLFSDRGAAHPKHFRTDLVVVGLVMFLQATLVLTFYCCWLGGYEKSKATPHVPALQEHPYPHADIASPLIPVPDEEEHDATIEHYSQTALPVQSQISVNALPCLPCLPACLAGTITIALPALPACHSSEQMSVNASDDRDDRTERKEIEDTCGSNTCHDAVDSFDSATLNGIDEAPDKEVTSSCDAESAVSDSDAYFSAGSDISEDEAEDQVECIRTP